jgi:hypothetical protein
MFVYRTGAYKLSVARQKGERSLGRPRHRWEENIKMDIHEVGRGMDWINMAQDWVKWQALLKAVMKFRVSCNTRNVFS